MSRFAQVSTRRKNPSQITAIDQT